MELQEGTGKRPRGSRRAGERRTDGSAHQLCGPQSIALRVAREGQARIVEDGTLQRQKKLGKEVRRRAEDEARLVGSMGS
ncbi:hypothetical protein Trco_001679 [Trichoderma cornu-damae]|uniref:Uncharacterized protein n=1 Tax=Trichoderma cornu-damae TaxID=654480 RepID=A0A9P8TXB2_9HYPO|nr:hypothetical protein Trco_001679 [Trichoderma cornu-damae]